MLLSDRHAWEYAPPARGGVSAPQYSAAELERSSPRPWGCFLYEAKIAKDGIVFPTPVGVFPSMLLHIPTHGDRSITFMPIT